MRKVSLMLCLLMMTAGLSGCGSSDVKTSEGTWEQQMTGPTMCPLQMTYQRVILQPLVVVLCKQTLISRPVCQRDGKLFKSEGLMQMWY